MKKKNGFIATSILYTFFIVFISMFIALIAGYVNNQMIVRQIKNEAVEKINSMENPVISNSLKVGDFVTFSIDYTYDLAKMYGEENKWIYMGVIDGNHYFLSDTKTLKNSLYIKPSNSYWQRYYPMTTENFKYVSCSTGGQCNYANFPFKINRPSSSYSPKFYVTILNSVVLNKFRAKGYSDDIQQRVYDAESDYVIYNDINNTYVENSTNKNKYATRNNYYLLKKRYISGTDNVQSLCGGKVQFSNGKVVHSYDSYNSFGYIHPDRTVDEQGNIKPNKVDYCYYADGTTKINANTAAYIRLLGRISNTYNPKVLGGKGTFNDPYIIDKGN